MVKKLVLQFNNSNSYNEDNVEEFNVLLLLNQKLLHIVTSYKDKITDYYKNKTWDKYKKVSNEYEHIFHSPNSTTNISLYSPVSRSFFKLWEILKDYEQCLKVSDHVPLKCVFLAEGPGGFFEAFHKKRQAIDMDSKDQYYGITLRSNNNRNIPDWKTTRQYPIKISYGKDGTGNLYNISNIKHFVKEVGEHTVDFITADGGFDFSSDFNNQEEQSLRLIASEVRCCLQLQKPGGSFLLKLYDCFSEGTLQILHILSAVYDELHFIKPLTSRPANSERYLLCNGYRGAPNQEFITFLDEIIEEKQHEAKITLSYHILYCIVLYNLYYTIRQVQYIQRTITYINFFTSQTKDDDIIMNTILDKHIKKSKKWCVKYQIPYKE